MKKVLLLGILCLCGLFITGASGNRYYAKVSSKKEAQKIAEENNATLYSYVDGIAVYYVSDTKIVLNSGLNNYTNSSTEKSDNIDLYIDSYCTPAGDVYPQPQNNKYYYLNSWVYDDIGWTAAYDNNITGAGVTVAILDTGCMTSHEDLYDNIIGTYNALDGGTNVTDIDGHGTHVAGIIAGLDNDKGCVGIAPDAKLYIMKVDSPDGLMYHSDIIKALNKCASNDSIKVINMSFSGGSLDPLLKEAIENCLAKGKICVMAAGNEGTTPTTAPAGFGLGLIVAYSTSYTDLAASSNYGGVCNVIAPGVIYSTYINGGYVELSGTSMATPVVSGIAALIYSKYNIAKSISGSNYVKNTIIRSKNGRTYSYGNRSISGGVYIPPIFNIKELEYPVDPDIDITRDKKTGQVIVELSSTSKKYNIRYTIDGTDPTVYNGTLYSKPLKFDIAGNYTIKAVAFNNRKSSCTNTDCFTVKSDVISNTRIKNTVLYINKYKKNKKINYIKPGSTIQIKTKCLKGSKINAKKFKWTSSNNKIATVNKSGKVTINSNAKKGSKVKIKAKLGSYTKTIVLTIK